MKRIPRILFSVSIIAVSVALSQTTVLAATAKDATASSTTSTTQIELLKERLATKVAELRSVVKRAMFGTVKSVSVASATVETSTKDIKIELGDVASVSQILSGKRTILSTDQISEGDPITVFGTYDATLDLLKAQYIFIESKSETIHTSGTVTEVDPKNFTVTFTSPEGRSVIVDIEKTTKSSAWNKTDGIVKSGFSKIAIGDTVHVVGVAVPKKNNHVSAVRVLNIGNVTGAKASPTPIPTVIASDSATPKPTVKPTLKPTAKPTAKPTLTPTP